MGAGKTTTLQAISGVIKATGEVKVGARALRGPAYRRCRESLGLVPEGRSVFASMTVAQNLRVCGVDPDAALGLFPEWRAAQCPSGFAKRRRAADARIGASDMPRS